MQEFFLDWTFDEDTQNNYKFLVEQSSHGFTIGDRVKLTVFGASKSLYGSIIHISKDGIVVHTDSPVDISESYSIESIDA